MYTLQPRPPICLKVVEQAIQIHRAHQAIIQTERKGLSLTLLQTKP